MAHMDVTTRPSKIGIGHSVGVLGIFIFACGFPAADHLLQFWDPIFLITFRISVVVATFFAVWLLLEGWQVIISADWWAGF